MEKVIINVEWCGHNFCAAPADERIACVVAADTLDKLKEDMREALRMHIEAMKEDGEDIPEELLGEFEPVFVMRNMGAYLRSLRKTGLRFRIRK